MDGIWQNLIEYGGIIAMGINNVRIDERLIHGQVANLWTTALQATRIMVVDDAVANDDIEKMALKLARPGSVKLSILTVEKSSKNILDGKYDSQNVFMVIKRPETALELIKKGVNLKEINVANMSSGEGKEKITRSVSITEKQKDVFEEIMSNGTEVFHQMVPNDKKESFSELLKMGGE